jgi:Contractile injection system tube protein
MILGELKKMTLEAYKDIDFTGQPEGSYTATINPETYTLDYEVAFNKEESVGKTASKFVYIATLPQKLDFEFLFDGTGALVSDLIATPLSVANVESVEDQLKKFKSTIFDFKGEIHQPPFVKLIWGHFYFEGRVEKMQIIYKLFKPDGTPLRAIAKVSFKSVMSDKKEAATTDKKSPDLTHIRTIKEGDTLPLLCHDIYNNATLYREVARVNRLINCRKLTVGQQLFFPPIEK